MRSGLRSFAIPDRIATTFPIDGWLRAAWNDRFADIALGRTPFDRSAAQRKKRATVLEQTLWVASAEDLVLYKLIAYRYRDLADAQAILTRRRLVVDRPYLRHWADEIAAHTGKFEVPAKLQELLEAADRA